MKVVLASHNPHKLVEISKITERFGFDLVLQSELGVDIDVEETGSTFEENSYLKAEAVMKATGLPALADDSGIAVDALNGEPGIYSARYGGENSDYAEKIRLLLSELGGVPESERGAHYACAVCCILDDDTVIAVEGRCEGSIAFAPSGNGGFGYDPVFLKDGVSFGELSGEQKDSLSHRGNALRMLRDELYQHMFGGRSDADK